MPSVRSGSSRFHSATRRQQFASVPSHTPPHSVARPPNLELALTPLAAFRCPDVSTGLCNDRVSVRCLSVWLSVPLIDSNSNNASILIDSIRFDDVILRTAIAQCTRSLGLGYKLCAVKPVAGQRPHGTTFRGLKVTYKVTAPVAEFAAMTALCCDSSNDISTWTRSQQRGRSLRSMTSLLLTGATLPVMDKWMSRP